MKKITWIVLILFWVIVCGAASAWAAEPPSMTWTEFQEAWDAEAKLHSNDGPTISVKEFTGDDPINVILSCPQTFIKVDMHQGRVVGATVSHVYKGNQNILGFRWAAETLLAIMTPSWSEETRSSFLRQKMNVDDWFLRKDVIIKRDIGDWNAFYFCTPYTSTATEEFAIADPEAPW